MNPMSAVLATASRRTSCSIVRSLEAELELQAPERGRAMTRSTSNSSWGVGAFS